MVANVLDRRLLSYKSVEKYCGVHEPVFAGELYFCIRPFEVAG